jgi:glycosyltransferase involved in cell wall biosynthesis
MTYAVIIPAHNEANYISKTLESLCLQSILPSQVIVVNDNSTDDTLKIVSDFIQKDPWISVINHTSNQQHQPGSKVINAFLFGFNHLTQPYDVIVKLDADLILPENYFQTILEKFESDKTIGMVGGFAYIEKNGIWILENLTDKEHIRGAFKAYRKDCYQQIGGLKPAMGWDTLDELLAKYHDWKVVTIETLKVKHLKPTGANYAAKSAQKQGEAFYSLGYGFVLTTIASFKLAFLKKKYVYFVHYLIGFLKSALQNKPKLVTKNEAAFIRNYRWKKIKQKLANTKN